MIHYRSRKRQKRDAATAAAISKDVRDYINIRSGEVTEVTSALRDMRERNHFAERLTYIMRKDAGDARP